MKSFVERIQQSESNCSRAPEVKVKGNNITIPAGKIMHVNYKPNVRLVKKDREQCFSKETWMNWNTLSPKRIIKKILCFWFRQDFAKKLFKHGTILESSPSPNWKWKHQILKVNFWNIAGRIITTIITNIIIILATIIIDQITTSIFLIQIKLSFSSNTLPIIFTSVTLSHSNILQPKMPNFFAYFSNCSTKITNINYNTTLLPRFSLSTQDNFLPYAICWTN